MKKLLIALLVVMMIIAAVGCGQKDDAADTTTDAGDTSQDATTDEGTDDAGTDAADADAVKDAALAYFAEYEDNNIVAWTDLFTLMDNEDPFILSIRQADVYGEGHIKGAYLASWGADLASKVSMLPTDQTVYVYCYSGQTAGQTIALLNMLGIDAVSVKSGFNYGAMKTEGYEEYVETEANELADAGAEFDADVLAFVENYFNTVGDNANNIVASADAKVLLENGEATLLDIRKAEDFEAAHIDGAVSLPYGAGMDFSDIAMDEKVIVTCYSGQTAGQTVAVMRALGLDAVSLKFGMNGAKGWIYSEKAAAANNYFAEYPGSRIITWEDLFAKMDAGENPFVVSIRQAEDYDAGHIKGAMLASWGADLASQVSFFPKDMPVYVYCYSGQTAGQAVALLNMLGVEAYSVKSGFNKGAMMVEGYEAYVDTEKFVMASFDATYNPFLLAAVEDYFNAIPEGGSNIMSLEDVQAAVDAGEATVVDIRTAEDFAAGHVAGAVNLPFGENMQEGFADLPAGKLIVACYSGQTAGQTTAVLRMLGYDACSMKYGMKVGWVAEGYPVVTD